MTKQLWVTGIALAVALAFTGCNKQDTTDSSMPKNEVAKVDTTSAQADFRTAEPEVRAEFDKAVAAVNTGDYSDALDKLKSLASNAKLTPEQQQAVKDLLTKVQEAVTHGATKAVEGAGKAMEDVTKSLPK